MKYKYTPLKQLHGSTYCQFSVVENQLRDLYLNQEIIYNLLQQIFEKVSAFPPEDK